MATQCPEPVEGHCYVYILLCSNGSLYVGQTNNVAKRLERHENGSGARHTLQLKQFSLVFVEGPLEPAKAIKRERQLKKWSRAKKIALIHADLEDLKNLSKSNH